MAERVNVSTMVSDNTDNSDPEITPERTSMDKPVKKQDDV